MKTSSLNISDILRMKYLRVLKILKKMNRVLILNLVKVTMG